MSRGNSNSQSNRPRTSREIAEEAVRNEPRASFNLKPGIRNFFIFVFIWCFCAISLMALGVWTFDKEQPQDVMFIAFSLGLPVMSMIFIYILEDNR